MSFALQEICVIVIVILSVAWIIWKYLLRKKDVSSCNCGDCPLTQCASRKNMRGECKKVDKKIAKSDK